ncbi:MAG: helix-turn-helix domain-containing protein [Ilumatobacteraceae bacterium]
MSNTPGPVAHPSATANGRRASVPIGNTVSWWPRISTFASPGARQCTIGPAGVSTSSGRVPRRRSTIPASTSAQRCSATRSCDGDSTPTSSARSARIGSSDGSAIGVSVAMGGGYRQHPVRDRTPRAGVVRVWWNGPMDQREELGAYLRARRDALTPSDVGLPGGRARRTKGLRREEVSMLAGVSVTWYTWLEQGRRINASVDVLEALARALLLDDAGRRHLLALASRVPDLPTDAVEQAPDALVRLIESMEPALAHARATLGVPRAEPCPGQAVPDDRAARRRRAQPALGDLRRAHRGRWWATGPTRRGGSSPSSAPAPRRWRTDARVVSLVDRLRRASTEFATWWDLADVASFRTRCAPTTTLAGELVFEYQQLTASEWPSLRVVCQLPVPGDDSAARLAAWREIV